MIRGQLRTKNTSTNTMDNNFGFLTELFAKLKTIGIFSRLFKWSAIKSLLIDASTDLQKLISNGEFQKETLSKLQGEYISQEKDLRIAREELIKKESNLEVLASKLQEANSKIERFTADNAVLLTRVSAYEEKITALSTESDIAGARYEHVLVDNKRLSELNAANEESVSSLSNRKAELEVELAEHKKDLTSLQLDYQEATTKIELLTGLNSTSMATIKANDERIIRLSEENKKMAEKNLQLDALNKTLCEEAATSNENISGLINRKHELELEIGNLKNRNQSLTETLSEIKKENTQLLHDEELRKREHSRNTATLATIQEQIQSERTKEIEERNSAEVERIRKLKATWSTHQDKVKSGIKMICQKHVIDYIPSVPFKGDPDNTLLICNEYVIFDAKSPGGDDLTNFPGYIKDQAEKARKYAKQQNVKTDIYFVVPTNTLECLPVLVHRFSDYDVYVISLDGVEPIILNLRKIEEYEFAEKMSPEDRDNICRVLGQFAHLSKRRIQVDSFFARHSIELAYKCENTLPSEILKTAMEFEKAGKLNPPLEKRAKAIPISEVEQESKLIKREAMGRGIIIQDEIISELLNEVPLHENDRAK